MFKTHFLAVLVSASLLDNSHQQLISFQNFSDERQMPPICNEATNGNSYCLNCVTSAFCFLSNGAPVVYSTACSGSTPVCGLDTSSPPKYACVASNSNCQCPGTPGLSYKPDPFNDHYYTTCSGTDRISINCGPNYYNPQKNDCSGTVPMTLCPGPGTFEDSDPMTCDGFIVCSSPQEIVSSGKCSAPTNYFNPVTKECENPIPPFRCQPGYIGYYADPFDCKRYYICNGITLVAAQCCSGATQWDNSQGQCTTTASCTPLPQCARATATTTTAPSSSTPTTTVTSAISVSSTTPSTPTSSTPPSTPPSSTTPLSTTTTTTLSSGCTPESSFRCPSPDGYFAQCSYCARTYFQCVSGTATLRTCTGSLLFNTVPSYPACLSSCPYYP